MKKFITTLLALALFCGICIIPTFASTDVDASQGTTITLVGSYQNSAYTVTVPSELSPGQSGEVTVTGAWHSNEMVTVTTPDSVTLSYGDQSMSVDIDFAGISQIGNETEEISVTATITVEDATALFGTWTGKLEYTVEFKDIGSATFSDGVTLTWDELQLEENGDKYGYSASAINNTHIGDYAFYECNNLTIVSIPDSVTSIGQAAFLNCTSLTSVTIPNSVIGDDAFGYCNKLTSVTIGNGVTSIGNYSFSYCDNLTNIIIHDSVIYIEAGAFESCPSLTEIHYTGTVEQWNAIAKADEWNMSTPATEVICSDGTVSLS